jgi:hypothetical protein
MNFLVMEIDLDSDGKGLFYDGLSPYSDGSAIFYDGKGNFCDGKGEKGQICRFDILTYTLPRYKILFYARVVLINVKCD